MDDSTKHGKNSKKRKVDGEWVIFYTPPKCGVAYSRALSWFAPDLIHDHKRFDEAMKATKEVIASQLDNPKHPQYVSRNCNYPEFRLVWIERYELQ